MSFLRLVLQFGRARERSLSARFAWWCRRAAPAAVGRDGRERLMPAANSSTSP
jgi:hypothetical protein